MSFDVEYFTLSSVDATNRYVFLGASPTAPDNVAMDIISGTSQSFSSPNMDFGVVDGSRITWNDATGYSLYNMLAVGDKLRIIYDRS
jgi:hypothetical protein